MIRRLAFVIAIGLSTVVSAQDESQQIKQQIQHLQQQLEAMENNPPIKRNVTQIGAARARKAETGLMVRIYDLGDLFAVAPPYPAMLHSDLTQGRNVLFETNSIPVAGAGGGGGMGGGGMGGGMFSVTPGARALTTAATVAGAAAGQVSGGAGTIKSSQDELIQVIRETIRPDLWKEGGKITKLGNAFVISADEDAHEQIEALLNLFRARWGTLRTVSVRAWWISLAAADLRAMLNTPTEKVNPEGPPVFGVISNEAWEELMQIWEQPPGNDAHRLRYQATVTAYNGQTVNTISGTQELTVSNIEPVVTQGESGAEQGQIGYRPIVSMVQQGLAFQVTPVTNVSGKTVLLDVHSRLSLPAESAETEPPRKKGDAVLPEDVVRPIDRRKLNIQRLSTTARVPVDRPYLIGGMSLAAPETDGMQLYLFVKVSVQELRNDQEPAEDKGEAK
ncbi:MAG: hypothetical protein JWP89_1358 [Schlesneria sp.]|nr:hypothetical protein [Schlesneria sp.]